MCFIRGASFHTFWHPGEGERSTQNVKKMLKEEPDLSKTWEVNIWLSFFLLVLFLKAFSHSYFLPDTKSDSHLRDQGVSRKKQPSSWREMRILVTWTLLKCNKYQLVATSLISLHAAPHYKAFGALEEQNWGFRTVFSWHLIQLLKRRRPFYNTAGWLSPISPLNTFSVAESTTSEATTHFIVSFMFKYVLIKP